MFGQELLQTEDAQAPVSPRQGVSEPVEDAVLISDASNQLSGSEPALITSSIAPNDSHFDKQWALDKIQALGALQVTSGSQYVIIAILDTGIDQTYIDLAGLVIASVNFTQSPTVDDVDGHGIHIAGIIGAIANNGVGIAGLAYNCSLMNVKVADDRGFIDAEAVSEGIVWAVDNGAKVINMSLTLTEPTQALKDAVDYAWSKGVILIAAAGNNESSTPMYPAYYANCLAVTATNSNDFLAPLANHGDWVDVAAPGAKIYSTLPGNSYDYKTGTSMATAYVASLAGLLFTVVSDANGDGLLNDEVRYMIESSCDIIGTLDVIKGCINAFEAAY
jgi:thermitase